MRESDNHFSVFNKKFSEIYRNCPVSFNFTAPDGDVVRPLVVISQSRPLLSRQVYGIIILMY